MEKKLFAHWSRLAETEVAALLATLPPEVQARARELPLTCLPRPTPDMQNEGVEPDLLGLFLGAAMTDTTASGGDLPPQIILFIGNLLEYAGTERESFLEEVRVTYLHELGHYLGLDEEDLALRDLE